MTRLKGKVISRAIERVPQIGAQIINHWSAIVKVLKIVPHRKDEFQIHFGNSLLDWHLNIYCKELYVQYWKEGFSGLHNTVLTVPLKYGQWQAAIDNGQVDSDKEVEFELVPQLFKQQSPMTLAKIIPVKKERLYTKVELDMKCKMAHHYGSVGRKFEDFIELHLK